MTKLKVLVISDFYPPYYIGGYELGCRNVVEGLKARGHEVKVLTSTYGIGKPEYDGETYRWLQTDLGWKGHRLTKFAKLFRQEANNELAFKRLCATFSPDVVYVWNLVHVSVSLAFMAQRMELPVCYFILDNWLSRWESDSWYSLWNLRSPHVIIRFGKRLLRPLPSILGLLPFSSSLDLHHVQFVSYYLRQVALQAGKAVTDAEVIHLGIDVNRYPYKNLPHNPERLLYVGQIVPHKGVHTIIEALGVIVKQHRYESTTLTIVGGTTVPDYEAYVRRLVSSLGLESHVHFADFVSHEKLPPLYQEHDILLFPSVWDEPLGLTLLEGMSSGLAVVGTATGGSSEILQDELNALVFTKEDAEACAAQVMRLMDDPELFERVRQNGRRTVEEKFRFESTMDKIENSLYQAAA